MYQVYDAVQAANKADWLGLDRHDSGATSPFPRHRNSSARQESEEFEFGIGIQN